MNTISVSGWLFEHPGEAAFAIGIGWFGRRSPRDAQREEGGTVLAIEALRKARTTMDCYDNGAFGTCPALALAYDLDETTDSEWFSHAVGASALLDGFSVDEVTAAEEALE